MASSNASYGVSVANSIKEPTPGDEPAAGDAAATGTFASRAKQALDAWLTLEKNLANVSSHAQVFSHVASAVDRHIDTEGEIQKKDAHIASLESAINSQFDKFEARYGKWDVDRQELEEKIEKIKTASDARLKHEVQKIKASHLQEVESLKTTLEGEKKKSAALEESLKDANSRITKGNELLEECSREVDEWNGYVSELKEVDFNKFDAKIKRLSDRCCTIGRKYFFCDLPEKSFLDQTQWEKLPRTLDVRLTFPPSNSTAAKHVRMAACLHIIARTLCTDIFKPCYIPESTSFSDSFKEILAIQFLTDESKERITRALILSTYPAEASTNAMMKTARISSNQIKILLTPLGANEKFEKELEKIFLEAGEIWKDTAQHSTKMIEALIEDDIPGIPWATMDEFTIPTANTTTTTTTATATDANQDLTHDSDMLNLFPCIYVPEDEKILFSGIRLLYSQGIVSAAEQEFNEWLVARRPRSARNISNVFSFGGSPTTRRERRMSSLPDGKGGFPTTSSAATAAAAVTT